MHVSDLAQLCSSRFQGFLPTDALPAGIGIALGPGAFEGIEQAVWVVDKLRRRPPLGAERLAGRV